MQKKTVVLTLALSMFFAFAMAGDVAWFNPNKCAVCMSMAKVPGLMENSGCEELNLSNGVVCVTTVKDEYLSAYRDAHAKMAATVARLQKGEAVDLCGSCTALGQIMAKGVNQDYVETQHGDVWILTSGNPEVAAELQGWAKRNNEEMAKLKTPSAKPAKM